MDDLRPSLLGTKNYWDKHYECELKNFTEFNDTGDIWFGKSSEHRVMDYLSGCNTPLGSRIVDLGCGNGHFCLELASRGYVAVTGVDYSENAIFLAQKLSYDAHMAENVKFQCLNLLSPKDIQEFISQDGPFDIAIDKGTFDAITLIPDNADPLKVSKMSRDIYLRNIHRLLRMNGKVVVTSCNWATEELRQEFERVSEDKRRLFQCICEVRPLSTFTFGGVAGSSTVCLAFRRLE